MGIKLFKKRRFEQEMIVHLDTLYRFALSLCRDPDEAEDLVQETMIKAYKAYDRFKKGSNAKAWLMTILRNTYLNTRRGTGKPGFFVSGEFEDIAGTVDTMKDVEIMLDARAAMEALNDLPEDFRTPIVLCDVEGLSYQEIAQVMDCPMGTVMSRIYRGRRMLRNSLIERQNQGLIDFNLAKSRVQR